MRRRARGDGGQVAVEFVGMVPLILLTLALMWQVVLAGYTYTLAANAADEGVRVCAVDGDYATAAKQHLSGAWADSAQVGECGAPGGTLATLTVTLQVPVLAPGTAGLFGVSATAGAISERAPES